MFLIDILFMLQYCCNSTVATVLLQQYCCNSTVATVLLQQYCCNSTRSGPVEGKGPETTMEAAR